MSDDIPVILHTGTVVPVPFVEEAVANIKKQMNGKTFTINKADAKAEVKELIREKAFDFKGCIYGKKATTGSSGNKVFVQTNGCAVGQLLQKRGATEAELAVLDTYGFNVTPLIKEGIIVTDNKNWLDQLQLDYDKGNGGTEFHKEARIKFEEMYG